MSPSDGNSIRSRTWKSRSRGAYPSSACGWRLLALADFRGLTVSWSEDPLGYPYVSRIMRLTLGDRTFSTGPPIADVLAYTLRSAIRQTKKAGAVAAATGLPRWLTFVRKRYRSLPAAQRKKWKERVAAMRPATIGRASVRVTDRPRLEPGVERRLIEQDSTRVEPDVRDARASHHLPK
jgi:hypothetical protein